MGHDDGLGKYPVVIALGDTLTREQTNEVMLRTNRWWLGCNDKAWETMVAHILGHDDRLNDNIVEIPGDEWIWDWQLHKELDEAFGHGIKALKLFALDNDAIMSHTEEGWGWLDWSGRIRARYNEGSKWTSIEEVETDWRDIAAAFPFLRLRTQLAAGTYLNDLPAGTVGAEWVIENGTVTRLPVPGKPLLPPQRWWQRHHRDWYQFPWWFSNLAKPATGLYYRWLRRQHARWPRTGYFRDHVNWDERRVSAPRLIEAVDQLKESVMHDQFTVTEQHLSLLRHANVVWNDSFGPGAPSVDAKRPYGSHWCFHDIAQILDPEGFAAVPDGDNAAIGAYEQANEEKFMELHRETQTVLDIVLRTGAFQTGTYERSDPWAHDWKRLDEPQPAP